jgi:hypothetical protein
MEKPKVKAGKITIDLTGPDGNAFVLIAYAKQFCWQLHRDFEPIKKEMMSGDYKHLLEIFDKEFGSFVTLYTLYK